MLALSPSLVSTTRWYLENNHTNYDQSFNHVGDSETLQSVLHFSTSQQAQVELDRITPPVTSYGDPKMHKKLNHNASERDRRKKVNDLYSSLRSLLPGTDRTVLIPSFPFYFGFFLLSLEEWGWEREFRYVWNIEKWEIGEGVKGKISG